MEKLQHCSNTDLRELVTNRVHFGVHIVGMCSEGLHFLRYSKMYERLEIRTVRKMEGEAGVCWGEKEVSERVCIAELACPSNGIQLINKSRYYHVFTIRHVCLNHSAFLCCSPNTWLLFCVWFTLSLPLLALFYPSRLCSVHRVACWCVQRIDCTAWLFHSSLLLTLPP